MENNSTLTTFNWYKIVNTIVNKLAKKYNKTPEQVTGVLVSLSGQTSWKTNITQCIELLKSARPRTGMFSGDQLRAANRILLSDEKPLAVWGKRSFKYRNFYGSIIDPCDPVPVCIDTHMINWYLTKYKRSRLHKVDKKKVFKSRKLYTLIQNEVRKEALKMKVVPSHAQAIIWVQQRGGTAF